MPRGRRTADTSLLEAALIGFQQMRRNVEEKIADIRRQLGSGNGTPSGASGQAGRRLLSAAARRRMAAVKAKSKASKPVTAKRTMSAAARKRIAAAQRKRWALVKAKKVG